VKASGVARDVCDLYLEDMFAAQQPVDAMRQGAPVLSASPRRVHADAVDQRAKYVNVSTLRNDIEVLTFDPGSKAFGAGGAHVTGVALEDPSDRGRISWVVGGELVTIVVSAHTDIELAQPILGFLVKDRLGQVLFSDNTYLTYQEAPPMIPAGTDFEARFTLRFPILPVGEYVVAASVAQGTQTDHVQLHWLHEALMFASHSSSTATGLVGVPAVDIVMERVDKEGA